LAVKVSVEVDSEMSANAREALAALAYAASNEQDGYRFYIVVAAHVTDRKGREMFQGLARDEVEHYHLLAAEYESLRSGKGWLSIDQALAAEVPPLGEFAPRPSDIAGLAVPAERLFPDPDQVVVHLDAGIGDLAAVESALAAEKRGYDIYRKAAAQASDANAKAAYELLMREESRHFEWLQRSQSYLANNRTYWDDSELPFFEG